MGGNVGKLGGNGGKLGGEIGKDDGVCRTPSFRKTERFHCAARATITDEHPVASRNLAMSACVWMSSEPPLAMIGIGEACKQPMSHCQGTGRG